MLGFPSSTEFNKRIPKQKFYENAAVPAAVKRLFADQMRCIYWRNKLAVSTLNLTAGERVTEIEIFELCLTDQNWMKLFCAKSTVKSPITFCLFFLMRIRCRLGSAVKIHLRTAVSR